MDYTKRVLIIRLSALGDVAILEPVLRSRAAANPDVLFLLAAPPVLQPLFAHIPNLQYIPTVKKQSARSLYSQLAAHNPDVVLDLHRVNRVVVADWLFRLHGIPVYAINKHKCKRRRMVRSRNKDRQPAKPMWQRYDAMFSKIALKGPLANPGFWPRPVVRDDSMRKVGVAPFAQHMGKIWPPQAMFQLLETMARDGKYQVYLFGGKNDASDYLDSWASQLPNVISVAGKHSFEQEMQIIQSLDLMLSMDSANMHFASCKAVPVVSIWGATHPDVGFYGYGQNPDWAVQSNLPCRPCSAFGNKPCRFGNYPCLNNITPQQVFAHVESLFMPQ